MLTNLYNEGVGKNRFIIVQLENLAAIAIN